MALQEHASVCTLEKVKSALDRAMGNPGPNPNWSPGSDGSASSTAKRPAGDEEEGGEYPPGVSGVPAVTGLGLGVGVGVTRAVAGGGGLRGCVGVGG